MVMQVCDDARDGSVRVIATCRTTRVFQDSERRAGARSSGYRRAMRRTLILMNSSIDSQIATVIASTLRVDDAMICRETTFAGDLAADSLPRR
jgi:hypothetical protein